MSIEKNVLKYHKFIWLALLAASISSVAKADNINKKEEGFIATYRLQAPGVGRATISHSLARKGHRIESHMSGKAMAIASANERSYFMEVGDELTGLLYASDYGLPGFRQEYRLSSEDLSGKIDRQMMIYQLSLDAISGHCSYDSPCKLDYIDHKARKKSISYYQYEHPAPENPEISRYPVTLSVSEEGRSSPLLMSFHPERRGLIAEAEMWRDDDTTYRLILRDVVFD